MNPWKNKQGFALYYEKENVRTGIRIRFEKGIEDVLRLYIAAFYQMASVKV